jgi:hypothetical protein
MIRHQNNYLAAAKKALAPDEQTILGEAAPGESVVNHCIRIAQTSRRAKARLVALQALMPAARDHVPGVIEAALELLRDRSRYVRLGACEVLATALDRATLPSLNKALDEGVEVPYNGIEAAISAIRTGNRSEFYGRPNVYHILQDEEWDTRAQAIKVVGSPIYGTVLR